MANTILIMNIITFIFIINANTYNTYMKCTCIGTSNQYIIVYGYTM